MHAEKAAIATAAAGSLKAAGAAASAVAARAAGRLGLALMLAAFGSAPAADASAQEIYVDGLPLLTLAPTAADTVGVTDDSLSATAAAVVDSMLAEGYYFARLDSVSDETAYLTSGRQVSVGTVRLKGVPEDEAQAIASRMDTRPGRVLDPERLEADLDQILAAYEYEGFPIASAVVDSIGLSDSGDLVVNITVARGPSVPLKRVQLPTGTRTNPSFVARLAGQRIGAPITRFDAEQIRRRLEETGLYESVGTPQLIVEPDTAAVLFIPLEEADPGSFDLVLGYLPPQGPADRGSIIGNGRLELRNLLGGGRRIAFRLNRLPDQVSSIDVSAGDPFLLGLPLGVEGRFSGLEQDSTYGKQSYQGEVEYRFIGGLGAFAGFSREVTRPGQAGLRLSAEGRQIVPRSDAWFLGLGMRFVKVDRTINPTRGLVVETNLETGAKEMSDRRISGVDTTTVVRAIDQKRLQGSLRYYVPAFSRQVLVLGADGAVLVSDAYDRSDLFRFGGATSLRGYDEERFLGRAVARGLAEYRFLIDRTSFAYVFVDVGYVDRPETPDLTADSGFHPGYGIGIQFRSALGLINVSAALNPEAGPTNARIHAGLSFGL